MAAEKIADVVAHNVCSRDPRSVYYTDLKFCDDEWKDAAPEGCGSCDNCFYGRHALTRILAQQAAEIEAMKFDIGEYQANLTAESNARIAAEAELARRKKWTLALVDDLNKADTELATLEAIEREMLYIAPEMKRADLHTGLDLVPFFAEAVMAAAIAGAMK